MPYGRLRVALLAGLFAFSFPFSNGLLAQRAEAGPLPAPLQPTAAQAGVTLAAQKSCGLRLDGAGPDARCSRYRDACLRHGNPQQRCDERLEACTRCGVEFHDCEKKVGRITGLLTTCEKCIASFKRCTREYDKRLPAKRP